MTLYTCRSYHFSRVAAHDRKSCLYTYRCCFLNNRWLSSIGKTQIKSPFLYTSRTGSCDANEGYLCSIYAFTCSTRVLCIFKKKSSISVNWLNGTFYDCTFFGSMFDCELTIVCHSQILIGWSNLNSTCCCSCQVINITIWIRAFIWPYTFPTSAYL